MLDIYTACWAPSDRSEIIKIGTHMKVKAHFDHKKTSKRKSANCLFCLDIMGIIEAFLLQLPSKNHAVIWIKQRQVSQKTLILSL